MIKKKFKFIVFFFSISIFLFSTFKNQNASEILLYADNISYDKENNIIAKGKAKILYQNKIITSDLIIYNKEEGEILLPLNFNLKDEKNNFYYGTDGSFSKDLNIGTINNVKILLNDGTRIVGKKAKRDNEIDIITKAVYSPCDSKIKISSFLCPIWQLEGEKMLHDFENLFLYQKHSKMRILNVPVFYSPYLVTPSPLRKKRKSGFLTPSINLNFFDTKVSQSTSAPYYFNISQDKELTFTPTINYGGGVDSSQRFNFDYNQIISGGSFNSNLTFDTTVENQNNEKWLKEGSFLNNYKKNLNENFNLSFNSALQTSKNYIQQTTPNDDLSYSSSLNTTFQINGYNLNKIDDKLMFNVSTYQSNQNNEDNKTLPTVFPHITYLTGENNYGNYAYKNNFEFYNISRDTPTEIHSKNQKKISSNFTINRENIKYNTKILFRSNFYNQLYDVEDKKINNEYRGSHYFRSFPIIGLDFETPFKFKKNYMNLLYTPKLSFVASPGLSNTNKISNEDSSINSYTIENNSNLNRFVGTDKLDNSKRINLELNIQNQFIDGSLWQSYEFTNNSNFHYQQGHETYLSDLLGRINLNKDNQSIGYDLRYDNYNDFMKSQNLNFNYENQLGYLKINYLDEKSKTNEIITSDNETINYQLDSKKINKYSKISYFGLYDAKNHFNKETGISYSYFDECFGINIDFKRNSYQEEELKPQDILTIMFSFKNIGSYKSTNLAVSETDKQDIEWESRSISNDLFN